MEEKKKFIVLDDGSILIRNWDDFRALSKQDLSESHFLEIEKFSGWILSKDGRELDYLPTHTFYDKTCLDITSLLREKGFFVTIDNWDTQ